MSTSNIIPARVFHRCSGRARHRDHLRQAARAKRAAHVVSMAEGENSACDSDSSPRERDVKGSNACASGAESDSIHCRDPSDDPDAAEDAAAASRTRCSARASLFVPQYLRRVLNAATSRSFTCSGRPGCEVHLPVSVTWSCVLLKATMGNTVLGSLPLTPSTRRSSNAAPKSAKTCSPNRLPSTKKDNTPAEKQVIA